MNNSMASIDNKNSFADTMLKLGRIGTFEPQKLSPSTLRSISSHIRTLERNNIELTEDALTINTIKMLDSLIDKNRRPLTESYKRQIGMTIKRLYPKHIIDLAKYNTSRKNAIPRLASPDFTDQMRKIVESASLYLKNCYASENIEDLSTYDTCHAILMSCSTSLRINELLQLRLHEAGLIKKNSPIHIRSKHHQQHARIVAPNDLLISIFDAIAANRKKVINVIGTQNDPNFKKYQEERFTSEYLLISSEDYMRKKLHVIAASNHLITTKLGFNSFRKYITTALIEGGGHLLAQSMNNHTTLNMTLDHYNVIGPQTAEKAYTSLLNNKNPSDLLLKPVTELVPVDDIRKGLTQSIARDQLNKKTKHQQRQQELKQKQQQQQQRTTLEKVQPVKAKSLAEELREAMETQIVVPPSRRPTNFPYETPAYQPGDIYEKFN